MEKAERVVGKRFYCGRTSWKYFRFKREKLAYDVPSTSVMVVPAQIKDADTTAKQLADILEADEKKIKSTLNKKKQVHKNSARRAAY